MIGPFFFDGSYETKSIRWLVECWQQLSKGVIPEDIRNSLVLVFWILKNKIWSLEEPMIIGSRHAFSPTVEKNNSYGLGR